MSRILVVDDDCAVCSAVPMSLEAAGYEVVVADGTASGLKALDDVAFSLLIVDIFMPHMRGFESVRLFHERAPRVPLVAISGYIFAELRTQAPDFLRMAIKLGASHCLRKPFTTSTLLYVVKKSLETDTMTEPKAQELPHCPEPAISIPSRLQKTS
jgi:DNA-binding NtrC family response regulator